MRTFQPKFNISNRMIAAITRTELARCTHIISGGLLAFALSSLASESNHLETLDSVQVVKNIRAT